MNAVGPVAALSAFGAIWLGHVAVRKIEFRARSIALPAALFVVSGVLIEWLSTRTPLLLSTALGIIGTTLLWDALELRRQQARVRKGHAPANPLNSRHATLLAEADSHATTANLLAREPSDETRPLTKGPEIIY